MPWLLQEELGLCGIEPAAIGNVTVCGFNSQGANALGV